MKLFYKAGACSLSPHIVLLEAGVNFSLEKVDLASKTTEHNSDFLTLNPKGQIPALLLSDGTLLTEGAAIVQYIADQVPDKQLLAATGNLLRYQTVAWLNYIGTELHKAFVPLFRSVPEEMKAIAREELERKFRYINDQLAAKSWLLGSQFTVADAYLFTVLRWAYKLELNLTGLSHINDYMTRMKARPAVAKALEEEGL